MKLANQQANASESEALKYVGLSLKGLIYPK
jgi:hypothetical protein